VGALSAIFGVSALFGLILSIPILLYQIATFLEPAVGTKPLKHALIYILISFLLAILGVITAYYLILPPTLQFLAKFSGRELKALISTSDYFNFITKYLSGFAILFQLPLVVFVIGKFVKLNAGMLWKYWRHVIVLSFIISAILTPTPDPVNQLIMAVPIIILYFISIATLALSSKLS
jgi:sec-independent protein translocase protein TatC